MIRLSDRGHRAGIFKAFAACITGMYVSWSIQGNIICYSPVLLQAYFCILQFLFSILPSILYITGGLYVKLAENLIAPLDYHILVLCSVEPY